MKHIVTTRHGAGASSDDVSLIPVCVKRSEEKLDTVVYSSRKSFLRQEMNQETFAMVDATELDKYYKNYLSGMGDTEKAFIVAVAHLGNFPVVGGLAMRWDHGGIYIDSNLNLYDPSLMPAFVNAVNNMVYLGRAICKTGIFKSCMFDARKTLHVARENKSQSFVASKNLELPFDISDALVLEDESHVHSYFEDGEDPDEMLALPAKIMATLFKMNQMHHTGCIIFESVEEDLKIHNDLKLLDPSKEQEFRDCLNDLLASIHLIKGLGVSGFMKLPYKDTKFFPHMEKQADRFCRK